jgi:hypothetical protein
MPTMPYTMEIGPVFSIFADYLEDEANVKKLLAQMRQIPVLPLTQMEVFTGAGVAAVPGGNAVQHIERDWFGFVPTTQAQPPFNPLQPNQTGWWSNWYGDAEAITRETMRCAVEVALGIPFQKQPNGKIQHDPLAEPTRCWWMQVTWTCGAPYFQGWVAWQQWSDTHRGGDVIVNFTTPGNGHPLYLTPHRPPNAPPPPNDYEDPAQTVDEYGLWIIGENRTDVITQKRTAFSPLGSGILPDWPNAFIHTHGDVCVVAPAEIDGGVLDAGRPWQ